MKITRPTLLVDESKCKANIKAMADKAKASNTEFIPHFKTHQSKAIGDWFKEYGVSKITVSSVQMAEYFANAGWKDIYIAFPCNVLEIERINNLAERINVTVLFSNNDSIVRLSNQLKHSVNARIEIDSGTGRTGFHYKAIDEISEAITLIEESTHIKLKGLYSHAGHSYRSKGRQDVINVFNEVKPRLLHLKNHFQLPIGFGDTPCCSTMDDFSEFDSLHPGNFVFYDAMQTQIGSCSDDEIGIALACPVVDKNKGNLELVVHGGGVHLSKDSMIVSEKEMFGKIVLLSENGWSRPFDNCYVKALSQEHGIIKVSKEFFERIKISDVIGILPVHSCMTADCMGEYYSIKKEKLDHLKSKL